VQSVGLAALIEEMRLRVPPPAVRSEIVSGSRRTLTAGRTIIEQYPKRYEANGVTENLRFALRYEPVDLVTLKAIFLAVPRTELEAWVRREPTSMYSRRIWYLYEELTGKTLDVPDLGRIGFADLLDPATHLTSAPIRVRRQRINDNLLGSRAYCPVIRRTRELEDAMASGLDRDARALTQNCEPGLLARAGHFLYTQETKSSFAIEGESPSTGRADRFVRALLDGASFDPSNTQALVQLQNSIVDARYAAQGWRSVQNYVSRTRSDYTQQVYYICPKPGDVPELMNAWSRSLTRMRESRIDPVSAAAAAAFGFVFIHPFEDGNGRIHRYLVHNVLARAGYTPDGLLFPVSAVMLRNRAAYDEVLARFSNRILPLIDYEMDDQGRMTVTNETIDLYRYWDATPYAEYLYGCIAETIRRELREEIGFLRLFDRAVNATMNIVDMPDRRASLLVRLIIQNEGRLANNRRNDFAELTDEELGRIELTVQSELACREAERCSQEPLSGGLKRGSEPR